MTSKIIYQFGDPLHGEVFINYYTQKTSNSKYFVKGVSSGLIALAIMGFGAIYGPVIREEINYQTGNASYQEIDLAAVAEANSVKDIQKEASNYGVESHFSVVIPKIGASENIIANVNPSEKPEYEAALKEGIAHAKGTYFPGQNENIFLFAHSTNSPLNVAQYNASFYLLNKLEEDDKIIVYFSDKKYEYFVTETHIVDSDDTSWLEKSEKEQITLQTCYPPGTTWKRLIVVAEPNLEQE